MQPAMALPSIFMPPRLSKSWESIHGTTCEEHTLGFDAVLLTEIAPTKTFSLPVRKMYLNTMSFFSYKPTDGKAALAARVKVHSQRAVRAVKAPYSGRRGSSSSAGSGKETSSIPTVSCRLRKRSSIQLPRFNPELAIRTPPHLKRRASHPHETYNAMTLVLGSGTAREKESFASRCKAGRWKKGASSAEISPIQ